MVQKFLYNKGDYDGLRKWIASYDWQNLLSEDKTVEETWTIIEDKVSEGKHKFIPCKSFQRQKDKKKSFVPKSVLDKIRVKRKAYKLYKSFRTTANYNSYARARNQVKWTLRKENKKKEMTLALNIKNDP